MSVKSLKLTSINHCSFNGNSGEHPVLQYSRIRLALSISVCCSLQMCLCVIDMAWSIVNCYYLYYGKSASSVFCTTGTTSTIVIWMINDTPFKLSSWRMYLTSSYDVKCMCRQNPSCNFLWLRWQMSFVHWELKNFTF